MGSINFKQLTLGNPKRYLSNEDLLFPYYAGYSSSFASGLLTSSEIRSDASVLDPWNGSGTTIRAANELGLNSVGVDLNPAMVVVAKAALLSAGEVPSLLPLAQAIVEQASSNDDQSIERDPLSKWLLRENTRYVRALETHINRTLIDRHRYSFLGDSDSLSQMSTLAAFFYVALFRTVRALLKSFVPTNPTWIKRPKLPQGKKRPNRSVIYRVFISEVTNLASLIKTKRTECSAVVLLGSSEALPISNSSIDLVVSSPPYCTRIDYAVATAIELAVLRFDDISFDRLRRSLMGTSTVDRDADQIQPEWGKTCVKFLSRVYDHPSKASKGYYFKNHLKYFRGLHTSLGELSRVVKRGGACVLVVQDSYYKELHNDVPGVCSEMAAHFDLLLRRRGDFENDKLMAWMNKRAKRYISIRSRLNHESVLCFERI